MEQSGQVRKNIGEVIRSEEKEYKNYRFVDVRVYTTRLRMVNIGLLRRG